MLRNLQTCWRGLEADGFICNSRFFLLLVQGTLRQRLCETDHLFRSRMDAGLRPETAQPRFVIAPAFHDARARQQSPMPESGPSVAMTAGVAPTVGLSGLDKQLLFQRRSRNSGLENCGALA
jgi:hypothetical protein